MPAPQLTTADLIRHYVANRTAFYDTLLARLPEPVFRSAIQNAIGDSQAGEVLSDGAVLPPVVERDVFLDALRTLDLLKNPRYGETWGRTTISMHEALYRAEQVEGTGLILFEHIAAYLEHDALSAVRLYADQRKAVLARLLLFHDALRYHRAMPSTVGGEGAGG